MSHPVLAVITWLTLYLTSHLTCLHFVVLIRHRWFVNAVITQVNVDRLWRTFWAVYVWVATVELGVFCRRWSGVWWAILSWWTRLTIFYISCSRLHPICPCRARVLEQIKSGNNTRCGLHSVRNVTLVNLEAYLDSILAIISYFTEHYREKCLMSKVHNTLRRYVWNDWASYLAFDELRLGLVRRTIQQRLYQFLKQNSTLCLPALAILIQ
jgi:hypothetical protein